MRTGASRWPLAGREEELDSFKRAWADRHLQGVVIFGGAGVGKSRLAEAFLARAVRMGSRGGRATATAAAAGVPLGAIAHLIPRGVDLSDPVRGFTAAAAGLAGPKPYTLLVDDLHLLDAASAVLLRQLLDARVVRLIGTVRPGERGAVAVAALADGSAVHRVDLAELDLARTEVVLEAALGGPLGRRTVRALHTATRGNLRYLRELVADAVRAHALADDGEIWELTGEPPSGPTLADLVDLRLAAVPAGRPVLELLALCEPLAPADALSVAPSETLSELEAAGLIRVRQDRRRTTLTLAYPVYGPVLRAGLSPLRRRTLLLDQCERTRARGVRRRHDALRLAGWELAATGTADPGLLVAGAAQAREAGDSGRVIALLAALPPSRHTVATRILTGEALSLLGRWEQAEAVLAGLDVGSLREPELLAVASLRTINLLHGGGSAGEVLAVNADARAHVRTAAGHRTLRVHEGYVRVALGQVGAGLALLAGLEPAAGDGLDADALDTDAWLIGAQAKAVGLAMVGRSGEAARWAERARAYRSSARRPVSHPAVHEVGLTLAATEAGRLAEAVTSAEGDGVEGARAGHGTGAEHPVPLQGAGLAPAAAGHLGEPGTSFGDDAGEPAPGCRSCGRRLARPARGGLTAADRPAEGGGLQSARTTDRPSGEPPAAAEAGAAVGTVEVAGLGGVVAGEIGDAGEWGEGAGEGSPSSVERGVPGPGVREVGVVEVDGLGRVVAAGEVGDADRWSEGAGEGDLSSVRCGVSYPGVRAASVVAGTAEVGGLGGVVAGEVGDIGRWGEGDGAGGPSSVERGVPGPGVREVGVVEVDGLGGVVAGDADQPGEGDPSSVRRGVSFPGGRAVGGVAGAAEAGGVSGGVIADGRGAHVGEGAPSSAARPVSRPGGRGVGPVAEVDRRAETGGDGAGEIASGSCESCGRDLAHSAIRPGGRVPVASHIADARRLTGAGPYTDAGRLAEAEEGPDGVLARIQFGVVAGRAAWLAGRPVVARRRWAEAASLARRTGHVRALRLLNAGLAACAALVGDLAVADAALAENATLPPVTPLFLSVAEERIGEAWVLAARGRQSQARAVLTDAAGIARATGHLASEALLLTDVARLGGAAEVAARLADLAGRCDGDLAPARARFAAALAAGDPAELLATAGELTATGQELLAAEAAATAAARWRRAGESRRATVAAREAAAYEAGGPGVRTPLLAGGDAPAPLSAREQEIAEFAAAGIASKEIAETLDLSVRTVHNHLQKIYRKLGINTRRELREILHPHTAAPCRVFPPILTIGPINRTDRDRRHPSPGRSR